MSWSKAEKAKKAEKAGVVVFRGVGGGTRERNRVLQMYWRIKLVVK